MAIPALAFRAESEGTSKPLLAEIFFTTSLSMSMLALCSSFLNSAFATADRSSFANGSEKPSAKQQRLEKDLSRAKDVIAEITAENLELKKGLSD